MGISYKDAEANELISSKTLNMLPKVCSICGGTLQFSDSLRLIHCTNTECKSNILDRCMNFGKKVGLTLNKKNTLRIINDLNIITPYQLLMLDEACESGLYKVQDIQNINDNIQIIKNIKQKEYFIEDIIGMCGIEEVSSIATKLFHGFNSIEEVFEEIDSSRVIFFNERLGIRSSDSTIISVEIYNKVLSIREELIFAETQLKVKKHNKVIRVAFSDNNIGLFTNKEELIRYMEYNYDITVLHTSNINSNTDILIRSGSSSNTKLRVARTLNEKYIAECINNGTFELNDIGKVVEGKIKPVGSIIYIEKLDRILERLDNLSNRE